MTAMQTFLIIWAVFLLLVYVGMCVDVMYYSSTVRAFCTRILVIFTEDEE